MQLKTYRARSMADALVEVKNDLGPNAVVLHTRSFRKGGVLGIGAKPVVEIAASGAEPPKKRAASTGQGRATVSNGSPKEGATRADSRDAGSRFGRGRRNPNATVWVPASQGQPDADEAPRDVTDPLPEPVPWTPPPFPEPKTDRPRASAGAALRESIEADPVPGPGAERQEERDLEAELTDLRRMVGQVLNTTRRTALAGGRPGVSPLGTLPEPVYELSTRLIENDVAPDLADEIIGRVRDELTPTELADGAIVRQTLLSRLESRIPTSTTDPATLRGRSSAYVIALVGPTGVGKTTTVAKLAASAKLRHGLRVGLITSDTYRIAAVEQLKTYAQIIGVPLEIVTTPEQLRDARGRLSKCEVVFVDTAGRSQNDQKRLGELLALVRAAEPDETHLVLSTTNSESASVRIGERFCALRPNHLILTKLDEAVTTGVIAALPSRLGLPVSHVTGGQEVPDDIEPARSPSLARLVLDGPTIKSQTAETTRVPR